MTTSNPPGINETCGACGACASCGSYGLCAADCHYAPWNQEQPAVSRFGYLRRLVKWCGPPVDKRYVFFGSKRRRPWW